VADQSIVKAFLDLTATTSFGVNHEGIEDTLLSNISTMPAFRLALSTEPAFEDSPLTVTEVD
jgi:hypothetical protein